MRRLLPIVIGLLLFAIGLVFLFKEKPQPAPSTPTPPPIPAGPLLSDLATAPNWSQLEIYQEALSKTEFERDLTQIYALPNSWQSTIAIEEDAAWVRHEQSPDSGESKIAFSQEETAIPPLPPIDQIHIAIDPGHIGGAFAQIEQRNFQPNPDHPDEIPVREGDLTLATARHLKPLLENLGAKVTLVRDKAEPVTTQRPDDFLPNFPDRNQAEKLFYRTAEIRARADLVNESIQPDLVLCLHYNAEAWNNPEDPWATRNHFHVLVNGAYMPGEVALDDQRFEMMRHLFTKSSRRAIPLAQTISDTFLRETQLVPFLYPATSPAIQVDPNRPIFARNLLANRLYQAPSIFLEPYVMNHPETYQRVQLGDYEGFRDINGTPRRSLVQEYALTLASAIADYFIPTVEI